MAKKKSALSKLRGYDLYDLGLDSIREATDELDAWYLDFSDTTPAAAVKAQKKRRATCYKAARKDLAKQLADLEALSELLDDNSVLEDLNAEDAEAIAEEFDVNSDG